MVVLVLVTQIEHGNTLIKMLNENNVYNVVFMHGGLSEQDRVQFTTNIHNKKYEIVIASTIFDEGFDESSFDVLILGGSGKSVNRLTQRIGRVLRPSKTKSNAIIYDFEDRGKYLSIHYKKRRKALQEEFKVLEDD